MYAEDDLLPISALQHLLFCERQCALIHVEQLWEENFHTAEGRILHERVDSGGAESRRDLRTAFGVELRSFRLGLVGRADVVEFHRMPGTDGADHWRPFPVEYKRGRPKKGEWDRIQLCAQAMCLEEMLQVEVPAGALFYGKRRRRLPVTFDKPMRARVEETANRLHDLVASGRTPPPEFGPHCEACSLVSFCMPKVVGKGAGWASAYVGALMYDD